MHCQTRFAAVHIADMAPLELDDVTLGAVLDVAEALRHLIVDPAPDQPQATHSIPQHVAVSMALELPVVRIVVASGGARMQLDGVAWQVCDARFSACMSDHRRLHSRGTTARRN